MGCCGQKRTDLEKTYSPTTAPVVTSTAPDSQPRPSTAAQPSGQSAASYPATQAVVTLHYLESSPILVRGPVTGLQYHFSGAHPDQSIDARDAEALSRTGFFRRSY